MSLISLLTGALVEDPELEPLKNATRLVTFLNGFSWVDPTLRRATLLFQRTLLRGEHHERLHALAQLHFSDRFLR